MKSRTTKLLKSEFRKHLEMVAPTFKAIRNDVTGERDVLYSCTSGERTYFVNLVPHRNTDEFTFEGAWSDTGQFPWDTFTLEPLELPNLNTAARGALIVPVRVRIGQLVPPYEPRLWKTSTSAGLRDWPLASASANSNDDVHPELIELAVKDAIEALNAHMVPFFRMYGGMEHV
jgi:hypothetical protein